MNKPMVLPLIKIFGDGVKVIYLVILQCAYTFMRHVISVHLTSVITYTVFESCLQQVQADYIARRALPEKGMLMYSRFHPSFHMVELRETLVGTATINRLSSYMYLIESIHHGRHLGIVQLIYVRIILRLSDVYKIKNKLKMSHF